MELFFGMGSQPNCTRVVTPLFNTSFEKGLYSSFSIDVSTLSIFLQSFTKSDSILHNFKFEQSNIYPYITKPNHKYLKRNFWYCGYLKRRYLNATFGIVDLFFGMGSQPDCIPEPLPPFLIQALRKAYIYLLY